MLIRRLVSYSMVYIGTSRRRSGVDANEGLHRNRLRRIARPGTRELLEQRLVDVRVIGQPV
jgi:hypothetical protein